MTQMCCISCAGARLMVGGPDHEIRDASGKCWRFEMHRWSGPIVLRADGEIATNQPGDRSPFWPAFEAWQAQQEGTKP